MNILRVEFENLAHFAGGHCAVDFIATDRVHAESGLFSLTKTIRLQNIVSFVGLNASGKTTMLRLLEGALQIVIGNVDLDSVVAKNVMMQDGTILRIVFFHENAFYCLESVIGITESAEGRHGYYKEEILKTKPRNAVRSKRDMTQFLDESTQIQRRSALDAAILPFLKDSTSIVVSATKGNTSGVFSALDLNHANFVTTLGSTPPEVLDVFDDSIEQLTATPQDGLMHYKVKFKNSNKIYDTVNSLGFNYVISAGTIKGQGLIRIAVDALQCGGYLLVDELETHLNKELVRVIIDLFKDPQTNPKGALLLFSTHYAEILDDIDRKDNIYITRKREGLLSVSKYADECARNDIKKSDVILYNALKGTAPSYEKIQRMREAICACV